MGLRQRWTLEQLCFNVLNTQSESPEHTECMCLLFFLQIQAHVAQTEVDPGAAVAWLRVTDDGLQASPVTTQLMRYPPSFAICLATPGRPPTRRIMQI